MTTLTIFQHLWVRLVPAHVEALYKAQRAQYNFSTASMKMWSA